MTACDRCGRASDDLQRAFDGQYCLPCLDFIEERADDNRPASQRSLDGYGDA